MPTSVDRPDAFVLVAVADPVLHPEAVHVAAATTRPVIDLTDPQQTAELRRYLSRAAAVLVDAEFAAGLGDTDTHDALFFLTSDRTPMDWEMALRCHATQAFILPAQSADLLSRMSELATTHRARGGGHSAASTTIAVAGAVGGAGASTFAAALARLSPEPVTLVDADPASGGLDLLLGIEDTPGARWPDLLLGENSGGLIDAGDLRAALPTTVDHVAVLSAARTTIADPFTVSLTHLATVLSSLAGGPGVVVVDLPAASDPPACDLVAVIVPTEVRATSAAVRYLHRLRASRTSHVVLTRRRAWSGMEPADVRRVLGSDPVADVATVAALPRQAEISGLPRRLPATLRRAAAAVLAEAGMAGVAS